MDVILYVVDSLRADHISHYGYERKTTPNLSEFSKKSRSFTQCFSPATWTRPVAGSLLTGFYPPAHGVESRSDVLMEELPFLPEIFSKAGFNTIGITSMGNVSSATKFDRGFDELVEVYRNPEIIEKRNTTTSDREKLDIDSELLAYPRAEDLNEVFFDHLNDTAGDTFFLIWSIDPHSPYDPPEQATKFSQNWSGDNKFGRTKKTIRQARTPSEFDRLINLYDDCIHYWDSVFGEMITHLKENRSYRDSVIAVVGDHGESFGSRNLFQNPFRGHNTIPYDEQIHVPFELKTTETNGRMCDKLTSLIDVPPTLLQAAGLNVGTLNAQGSAVTDQETEREYVFSRTQSRGSGPSFSSVRSNDHKYIHISPPSWTKNNIFNHYRQMIGYRLLIENNMLYDVRNNPEESENIYSDRRNMSSRLEDRLDEWIQACNLVRPERVDSFEDAVVKNQLQALGYET